MRHPAHLIASHPLRLESPTTVTNVAWYFSVAFAHFVEAVFLAHLFENLGLKFDRVLIIVEGARLLTAHGSRVAVVTFEIDLFTVAGLSSQHKGMLLTVKALRVLLFANVGNLLAEEAIVIAMAAVVRSPQLKVRIFRASILDTLALGHMKS